MHSSLGVPGSAHPGLILQWIGISVRFDAGGGLAVAQTCCSTGIKEGDEQPSREELIASLHLVNERNSELADEIKRLREEVLIARSSDGTHDALTSKLEMLMHDNRMLRHQLIPSIEDVHPDGLGARAPERTDGMDRDVSYKLRAGLPGDHFVSSMKRLEALPHQHGAERKAALQNLAADLAELREHVAARTAGRKPIASALSATVAASHSVLKSATLLSSDGDPSTAELCTLRDEIQAAKLADLDSARKPTVWPRSCGARRSARRAKMFVTDKSTCCAVYAALNKLATNEAMLENLKCHCNELSASRDELKASVHEFMTESRKLHGTVEQQARLKPHCCLGAQLQCGFRMGTLGLSWTLCRIG